MPGAWAALASLRDANTAPQRAELVLLHDELDHARRRGALAGHAAWAFRIITSRARAMSRASRGCSPGMAIGIVFSGGGARGFAHIGIVKALREAGIPIDLVGGTSMGGIMGGGVAANWSIEEMTRALPPLVRRRQSACATTPSPFSRCVTGRKVSTLLHREFGDVTIEDLPLPFFCVSSNLTTGHSDVHRRGTLWRWLRASVAIPGVLPPVMNNGEVLVDGGTMNNLPVDAMRELGRGPVIGCDVGGDRAFTADGRRDGRARRRGSSSAGCAASSAPAEHLPHPVARRHGEQRRHHHAPTARRPTCCCSRRSREVDMLNWKAFDRAIALGYEYTVRRLAALPERCHRVEARPAGEAVMTDERTGARNIARR